VPGQVAFESVGPERWDRQVVGALGHVQGRKNSEQFGDVVGLDALLRTFAVQLLQTLVSEAQDHPLTVSRNVSRYDHLHPRLVAQSKTRLGATCVTLPRSALSCLMSGWLRERRTLPLGQGLRILRK
jgi:hypothetical protein